MAGKSGDANKELERLFGPNEQQDLTFIERMKLKLVGVQYRKETLIFRMFFDKYYRPERYDAIVNHMDEYKNINEFRTYVIQTFYKFPLSAAKKLTYTPASSTPSETKSTDASHQQDAEDKEKQGGNILLEKKFLNLYTSVFKTELGLYFLLGNAIFYMGIAFTLRQFSRTFMMGLLVPGICLNALCVYARTLKYREYELQIGPLYRREIGQYKRFFHDEGYDDE